MIRQPKKKKSPRTSSAAASETCSSKTVSVMGERIVHNTSEGMDGVERN